MSALAHFKNASLGYGGHVVLRGVDLDVQAKDFWGILGPNGAGKSTILKTLLGLIPPIKGQFGAHGTRFGPPRFGYVPQKERLDPIYPLSAFEVAAMGAYRKLELLKRLRGISDDGLIWSALKDCGASELGPKRYSDLSGGQKQRVLIARALAAEPELLILDEPLAGIDVSTQKALLDLLTRLKKERNLTVLMVSHRLQAEKDIFTHIAWVDEGKVDAGPADKMLDKRRIKEIFGREF